jgi:hypothetical protein
VPLHDDVVRPVVEPKKPAGHGVHAVAVEFTLNRPMGHSVQKPALLYLPEAHPSLASQVPPPPRRFKHVPQDVSCDELRSSCFIIRSTASASRHVEGAAPPERAAMLTVPMGHKAAVAVVEPLAHTYPGAHGPVQLESLCPVCEP